MASLPSVLSRACALSVDWSHGEPIGRSAWPLSVACASGIVPGGCALFVVRVAEATCTLALTSPVVSRLAESVSCSCEVKMDVSRSLLRGRGYSGSLPAVYFVAPPAVVVAVSVSLCEMSQAGGASSESPLRFASLSRMLLSSVLALDAVVSFGCHGAPVYRVTRVLPAAAAFVRVTADTRVTLTAPPTLASTRVEGPSSPASPPNAGSPSVIGRHGPAPATPKSESPWKSFKAVHTPGSSEAPRALPRVAYTPPGNAAASVAQKVGADEAVLRFSAALTGPERALWDAVAVQVAACRVGARLPSGSTQKSALVHGPDGVGKSSLVLRLAGAVAAAGLASVLVVQVAIPSLLKDCPFDALPARRLFDAFTMARAFPTSSDSARRGVAAASHATSVYGRASHDRCQAIRTSHFAALHVASATAMPLPPVNLAILLLQGLASAGGATAANGPLSTASALLHMQLKQCLRRGAEGLEGVEGLEGDAGPVLVVGTAESLGSVDAALVSARGFSLDIAIKAPDAQERVSALQGMTAASTVFNVASLQAEIPAIAALSAGLTSDGLRSVCSSAALSALRRHWDSATTEGNLRLAPRMGFDCRGVDAGGEMPSETLPTAADCVLGEDLRVAVLAARANGFPAVMKSAAGKDRAAGSNWDAVGGMAAVTARLRQAVEAPLQRSAVHMRMGVRPPRGVLLYGPPGNSKTSLVRILASSLSAAFLSITGAEVYSAFVGEAERAVRDLFRRARALAPAVVFLDEVDALVGSRGIGGSGGSRDVSTGILATLLTEMDGVESADGVVVVGATNRPEALDPALLRPGRLEVHIHVPRPAAPARSEILRVHLGRLRCATAVMTTETLADLAARTDGWSGAELENLCREAAMAALREGVAAGAEGGTSTWSDLCVEERHVLLAFAALNASKK